MLTSSQHIITDKKLSHGFVVIPRQQTEGAGRLKNRWLSPIGCAAFSLQMHIPLDSNMGMRLSMIQHMVMVAIVSALKKINGCEVCLLFRSFLCNIKVTLHCAPDVETILLFFIGFKYTVFKYAL